jgi:hypothetical protein
MGFPVLPVLAEEAEEELITITSKLIIIYIDYIKSIFIIIIINK